MEQSANGGTGGDPPHNKNPSVHKGKSCKGCLYYSSLLKSGDRSLCAWESRGPFHKLLVDKATSTAGHAPSHAHKEARSQLQGHKPAHSSGEFFFRKSSALPIP